MKYRLPAAFAFALASSFSAWGQTTQAATAEPAKAEAAPVEDRLASGLLMQHGDRLIFAPCRDRSYTTVDDLSPQAVLTTALKEFGLAPGTNLYVEFVGKLDGGMLRVSGINLASREARCRSFGGAGELWRAAGEKPGWQVVAGEGQLRLKREGKPDWQQAYGEIRQAGETVRISTPGAASAEWQFRRQFCHDKAASLLFGWQAEIRIDGETLHGCAWQR